MADVELRSHIAHCRPAIRHLGTAHKLERNAGMPAQAKKNLPPRLPKQPAHEVLVEMIESFFSKRRMTPSEKIWVEVSIYLLGRMVIPGDKLASNIAHLKQVARRSLVASTMLNKLTRELERDYQDHVR